MVFSRHLSVSLQSACNILWIYYMNVSQQASAMILFNKKKLSLQDNQYKNTISQVSLFKFLDGGICQR